MKMLVSGVQRISGTSKAGSAFDMCNLIALTPIEQMSNGKIVIAGYGLKVMEIPMDNSVLVAFAGLQFPVELDLQMDARPRNGKFETVVTGFLPLLKKAG